MTHVVRPRMTVTMFSMYPEINISIMYKLLMLGEKYMAWNKTIPLFLHRFDIKQGK